MDLIKNLFMLQDCYNKISKYNSVLKDEERLNMLKGIKEKYENAKVDYENNINSLKTLERELLSLESKQNLNSKEMERLEHELYTESGSDLKLIENIESKIEAIKESNDEISERVDQSKTPERELKISILKNRKYIQKLKDDFIKEKKEFSQSIDEAKKKLPAKLKERDELAGKIPSSILNNFEYLIKNKDNAVSELKDGICLGCRMMVSSMTIDELNKGKEIVYCDNCGRILYYNK
ncbi:MAG: C4-type zinc ribbon domain-containing protein [Bacillota bacterium]|nr:C4-type zinc ribbon domain-containing protein [Bacillota bacterium]